MATLSAFVSSLPPTRTRVACAVALACALGALPVAVRAAEPAPGVPSAAAGPAPESRPERPHGNLVPPELPPLQDRLLDTVTHKVPGVVGGW